MLSQERKLELESEAERVRNKYLSPGAGDFVTNDLEIIAKREYGVSEVVKTTFARPSEVISHGGEFFIAYYAYFKPYLNLALSHEIGHIAAGHFKIDVPPLEILEEEADWFSVSLNQVSFGYLYRCREKDAFNGLLYSFIPSFLKHRESERERLRQLGIYELLK